MQFNLFLCEKWRRMNLFPSRPAVKSPPARTRTGWLHSWQTNKFWLAKVRRTSICLSHCGSRMTIGRPDDLFIDLNILHQYRINSFNYWYSTMRITGNPKWHRFFKDRPNSLGRCPKLSTKWLQRFSMESITRLTSDKRHFSTSIQQRQPICLTS